MPASCKNTLTRSCTPSIHGASGVLALKVILPSSAQAPAYPSPGLSHRFSPSIKPFLRIQLGAVTWQVKQLNWIDSLCYPSLDKLTAMNLQVVQNQEHLFACIFEQSGLKFDELVRIKGLINDHPAGLAQIGHRGNHRQLVTCTAHGHCHRCFARWRVAPAAHVSIDQSSLITPVNFCSFASCALLYAGVLPLESGLRRS